MKTTTKQRCWGWHTDGYWITLAIGTAAEIQDIAKDVFDRGCFVAVTAIDKLPNFKPQL